MFFLIGIVILITFCLIVYLKIKSILRKAGLDINELGSLMKEVRFEEEQIPKNLASMDSIYLKQIKKDFPSININELKRKAEKIIIDCYNAIENKNTSILKGKVKAFAENIINDNKDNLVKYDNLKIHNTVISNYKCSDGIATIYFSTAFEYYLNINGSIKKVQDRVKVEFIYIIDEEKIPKNVNLIGLHCPNCGSPITSLGDKKCSYCGGKVEEIISRTFTCNDIVRY